MVKIRIGEHWLCSQMLYHYTTELRWQCWENWGLWVSKSLRMWKKYAAPSKNQTGDHSLCSWTLYHCATELCMTCERKLRDMNFLVHCHSLNLAKKNFCLKRYREKCMTKSFLSLNKTSMSCIVFSILRNWKAQWRSGRVSSCKVNGPRFNSYWGQHIFSHS